MKNLNDINFLPQVGIPDLLNPYRNHTLTELSDIACQDDNKLAIAILNEFQDEVDLLQAEIDDFTDRIHNDVKDYYRERMYRPVDCLAVYDFLNSGKFDWYYRKFKQQRGYIEAYTLKPFDRNEHPDNHHVVIERAIIDGHRLNFKMTVCHGIEEEKLHNVDLKTHLLTDAKKKAIEVLKDLLRTGEIELILY